MTKCTHCDATVLSAAGTSPADILERIAREQLSDPATDDLTVPLAIELSEMTTRALKAEAALAAAPGEASWRSGATPAVGGLPDALTQLNSGIDRIENDKRVLFPDNEILYMLEDIRTALLAAQPASPLRGRGPTLTDDALNAAVSEYYDMSPRSGWSEAQRVGMRKAILTALSASPPEQLPTSDTVKMLVEAIDAKNARIAQLEEALGKAVLSDQPAAVCCKGLAPVSECQCEQERLAAGHAPYQRSAPAADLREAIIKECELAARGAVYKEIYNGCEGNNWSMDSEYGRGRHAAADAVRALSDQETT